VLKAASYLDLADKFSKTMSAGSAPEIASTPIARRASGFMLRRRGAAFTILVSHCASCCTRPRTIDQQPEVLAGLLVDVLPCWVGYVPDVTARPTLRRRLPY
jgi:hypothetical protein